jgi:hypothetical protein
MKIIKVRCKKFKEGDCICHANNYKAGLPLFFMATEDDVDSYSGKNGWYYKLKIKQI